MRLTSPILPTRAIVHQTQYFNSAELLPAEQSTGPAPNLVIEHLVSAPSFGGLALEGELHNATGCVQEPCVACILENTSREGRIGGMEPGTTIEACQAMCQAETWCLFWELNRETASPQCRLYEEDGDLWPGTPATTGPKFC